MIRKAQVEDIEALVELGVEFGLASQKVHTLPVSADKIHATLRQTLVYPDAVLLVLEIEGKIEGVIYGMVLTSYFSEEPVLQELALYSRKQKGGLRLIEAFEAEAKARGIKKIVVGSKPAFCDLRKMYEKRNYKFIEKKNE